MKPKGPIITILLQLVAAALSSPIKDIPLSTLPPLLSPLVLLLQTSASTLPAIQENPKTEDGASMETSNFSDNDTIHYYLDQCPALLDDLKSYFCREHYSYSCANRCGEAKSNKRECACDRLCSVYGDCCDDLENRCPQVANDRLDNLPVTGIEEAEVTCWNGVKVITGRAHHNIEHREDLRQPLASQGQDLHFKTAEIHELFPEKKSPMMMMRRMRQMPPEVEEWHRSIYLLQKNTSLADLEAFINTGNSSVFQVSGSRDIIRYVDVPPDGISGRKCIGQTVFEARCKKDLSTENCKLPTDFKFIQRDRVIDCSIHAHAEYVNMGNNNARMTGSHVDNNDEEGSKSLLKSHDGVANISVDTNDHNFTSSAVQTHNNQNNSETPLAEMQEVTNINVTEIQREEVANGISRGLSTTQTISKVTQNLSLSHEKNTSSKSTVIKPNRFQDMNSLSIRFEDDEGPHNPRLKSIRFDDTLSKHSLETVSSSLRDFAITTPFDDGKKRVDLGHNVCDVQIHEPEANEIDQHRFIGVGIDFPVNQNVDIFVPNPESSISNVFCNRSKQLEGFDEVSGQCHLSIVCKPGFVPIELSCRQPSKLDIHVYGIRNLTLNFEAVNRIGHMIMNFSDEPSQLLAGLQTSMGLMIFHPDTLVALSSVYLNLLDPMTYQKDELPMTDHVRRGLEEDDWFMMRMQDRSIHLITLCLIVEAGLYDDDDWLVCDSLHLDSRGVKCKKHFKLRRSESFRQDHRFRTECTSFGCPVNIDHAIRVFAAAMFLLSQLF